MLDLIDHVRAKSAPSREQALAGRSVLHEERKISGPQGEITLAIVTSTAGQSSTLKYPGFLFTHGGGMISGNRNYT
jgi:acetyl esterase/lipase